MKSLHRRFTQRSFHTQKLLHKEVFTQSGFYTQKLLHTKAFTQRSLCTEAPLHEVTSWNWQQFFGKNPRQELSGTHLLPKKAVYFQQSSFHELFSKNIRNIFLKQVPIQKLSSPHCDEMEGREIRRSRRGASALKSGQGPPGRGIAVGVSLLSVGERGCAPCRRPPRPPKTTAFYGVLCASHFFLFFGSCGLRWVNMGQHRPQAGPT